MFPPIGPVRPELINLRAICEEMCNVISFTTVVNDNDNDNENTLFDHNIQIEITIYKQFK